MVSWSKAVRMALEQVLSLHSILIWGLLAATLEILLIAADAQSIAVWIWIGLGSLWLISFSIDIVHFRVRTSRFSHISPNRKFIDRIFDEE